MNLPVKSIKLGGQQQDRLIPEIPHLQNVDLCIHVTVSAPACLSPPDEFQGEHICDPPHPQREVKVNRFGTAGRRYPEASFTGQKRALAAHLLSLPLADFTLSRFPLFTFLYSLQTHSTFHPQTLLRTALRMRIQKSF